MGRKVEHVFGTFDNISTIPSPTQPTLFQIVTEVSYGKNLANGVDFLWVACFLGPSRVTWCAPKRPKQHLKHWGGVGWGGRAGKGGKSSSSNWIVPTTSTFFDDPKIKWWIFKILLHVQLFPNKVEWFNFYYTQESERESKLEDANRGEWSKVCIAQMWSQLATCNIGCSHLKFYMSHLKCYLGFRV